jgi:hypothetical protein
VLLNDTLSLQKKGLGWHMAEDGLGSLVQHLAVVGLGDVAMRRL